MNFTPVQRKSLSSLVFEQLRDQILSGLIEPGDALPSERVLAEMLAVNRGAVREALKRLEHAGLVEIHQGGSTRALDFRSCAGPELLGPMTLWDGRVVLEVARSVLEMRVMVLPSVARLAADRGGQDVARELAATLHQMQDPAIARSKLERLSLDYWGVVAVGAENLALRLTWNRMRPSIELLLSEIGAAFDQELAAFEDYGALASAIGRGEAGEASRAARAVLRYGTRGAEAALGMLDDRVERFGD